MNKAYINKIISNVKATLAIEGLEVGTEAEDRMRRYLREISSEEAIREIYKELSSLKIEDVEIQKGMKVSEIKETVEKIKEFTGKKSVVIGK